MKRNFFIFISVTFGVIAGFFQINFIGETNIIQDSGLFSDCADNGAPTFAGLVVWPLLSFCSGYVIWRMFRALIPSINKK